MARVHFVIPSVLCRYSDGEPGVEVDAADVAGALEAVFARFPDLRPRVLDRDGRVYPYLILFLDGSELPREGLAAVALSEGDEIELVGAAEGGSGEAPESEDVRMRGFRRRVSVGVALAAALEGARPGPAGSIAVSDTSGRVLAEDLTAECAVPPFRRSAMDGYAVRAADTFGASTYAPLDLSIVGESMPGAAFDGEVGDGQACRIMTGAPVPDGADAVLRAEVAAADGDKLRVLEAVSPGKNVGRIGEDVAVGDALFTAGRHLRPQDIGLLASVGCAVVPVVRRPRVVLLMTGNELRAAGEPPSEHGIVDSNTPMLRALVERDGGEVVAALRLADERDTIQAAVAALDADVLVAAGGTSVGREDYLPLIIRELGELPVHGVAMRPAAPTGIGRIGDMRVFLLPGNPVSCLSAYDFFAGPLIRTLAGLPAGWPYGATELPLTGRIASQLGRTDYARVRLVEGGVEPIAVSGASVLSSTTRADGFVIVPESSEGLPEGATVVVHLYDAWSLR